MAAEEGIIQWEVVLISQCFMCLYQRDWIMSEFDNDQKKQKKEKYTCPCGFSSYDLMEFLRHPFFETTMEQDEKLSKKLKEEEK